MEDLHYAKDLETLLQIENDDQLLQYVCQDTDIPIWSLIRIQVLRTIMSDWLFTERSFAFNRKKQYVQALKGAFVSAVHNLSVGKDFKKEIIIHATGAGNYAKDGVICDRIFGYFPNALSERTLVYQDYAKKKMFQKYSYEPVIFSTPKSILNKLSSRIYRRSKHRNLAERLINHIAKNAYGKLGYEFSTYQKNYLVNSLINNLVLLPHVSDYFANWYSKEGFKLLLKEDACYGGQGVASIHAARLAGLVVAEYQHGAISRGHDAYNVADAITRSDGYKSILPDFLLTYGDWWSKQVNIPVKKIAIGNPHLTESNQTQLLNRVDGKRQVLILGDGVETNRHLELSRRLSLLVNEKDTAVTFRPHPMERETLKSRALPHNVQLDFERDITLTLRVSHVVIGEITTSMFEAMNFGCDVIMWESAKSKFTYPEMPFASFSTIDELAVLLDKQKIGKGPGYNLRPEDLWARDWKFNFKNFVDTALG